MCGNVFVFVGENSGAHPGTLVLPWDKVGSDGNTQPGTNWSFVKIETKSEKSVRDASAALNKIE